MTQIAKRKMTRFEKVAIGLSILVMLAIIVGGMISGARSLHTEMECAQFQGIDEDLGITADNIGDYEDLRKRMEACGIDLPKGAS